MYAGIKLLIAAAAFVFIYREVISRENFSGTIQEYRNLLSSPGKKMVMLLVLLLMGLNWTLEALKWKFMMRKLEAIPIARALVAVFSGLTVSFFTPNRIGEYAGRIFHLRSADRIKATLVTILENFSQLIITIAAGSISLVFYMHRYVNLHAYLLWVIGVLMFIFAGVVLMLFLQVPFIDKAILKIKGMRKLGKYLEVVAGYKKSELLILLGLALCRYLVFTFQFYLLLSVFGVETGYATGMLLINMVFFVMTLVPTFALSEIGVRGAVATYFFSRITYDSLAVLNATLSLWMINLVIPALLGIICIFQFRFSQSPQQ